jgi:hypothetical protein
MFPVSTAPVLLAATRCPVATPAPWIGRMGVRLTH